MRTTWREFLKSLTREPQGFRADGRVLGLGLAAAQDESRRRETEEVENALRRYATREPQQIAK